MEQNLEQRSTTALTQSTAAGFVHDMKDLEIRQFTLTKLLSECANIRKKFFVSSNALETAKNNYQKAETDHREATQKLNMTQQSIKSPKVVKKPKSYEFQNFCINHRSMFFILAFIVHGFLFMGLLKLLLDIPIEYLFELFYPSIPIVFIFTILTDILICILFPTKKNAEYDEYIRALSDNKNQHKVIKQH